MTRRTRDLVHGEVADGAGEGRVVAEAEVAEELQAVEQGQAL